MSFKISKNSFNQSNTAKELPESEKIANAIDNTIKIHNNGKDFFYYKFSSSQRQLPIPKSKNQIVFDKEKNRWVLN